MVFSQTGHIMQGIGAFNMSMGGAATAQPLDIGGALQWNPAGISVFEENILSINAGMFFSDPELSSTVPTPQGLFSGVSSDERGLAVLPAVGVVFGKPNTKHTFGISAFGVSGFGVTFPESMTNPINMPQNLGGFGHIESEYILFQLGLNYAYELNENLSFGIAPILNYGALELAPNPLAFPSQTLGYPNSRQASVIGFGLNVGMFYETDGGFKVGVAYKSPQYFNDFEFDNIYLDNSTAPVVEFKMNYPGIFSAGVGYSNELFDLAIDYRFIDYENTEGFEASGWSPQASVKGFGWESISVISSGVQLKLIDKIPFRVGYTYSGVPIKEELAFFSVPATAIINNAFQFGFGYEMSDRVNLNFTYHHGSSGDGISGPILNPMLIGPTNPLGSVPSSDVSYTMTTDMFMIGIETRLGK
jgi:long-chain fatty acid transport protein